MAKATARSLEMRQVQKPDVYKKKVLVVGLGVSGLWSSRWLAGQGADVTVSEIKAEADLDPDLLKGLRELGVVLETGGHRRETFFNAEMIIVSPGVPHDMEVLRAAVESGVSVMGELELASRLIDTPMIAVTGTNGKSTVTALLGLMLENAGVEVFVGGNIGRPLMEYAGGERNADYAVVEVSSFQLDTVDTFCPSVSMVLNISPDHLDRYPHYEAYVQSKQKIFKNQGSGQYVILNDDDPVLSSIRICPGVSVLRYGLKKKGGRHAFIENRNISACLPGMEPSYFSFKSMSLHGEHNLENLLAVVLAGVTLGVSSTVIQETIEGFRGLPNRLERVGDLNGVVFYNDSKATNVDAAARAVKSFDQPLILIAGGRHKGADYAPLAGVARGRVKKAVLLGEARNLLAESFEGVVPFLFAKNMEEAVSRAYSTAEVGDVVLLAPACSSFDMFSNYSHRGAVFKAAVERLPGG
ncbi:MAG: UDP-N-acetylmuramoyl-L-alanine--D-glutamate ligase [Thermodesulfobacteriota bacterium]|nr:UDP-N-acetylmuramoyl-L-alanine--D-glutamate ligase [Thermodesulfobacteriota bacterium]